jgi:hypothetical protein
MTLKDNLYEAAWQLSVGIPLKKMRNRVIFRNIKLKMNASEIIIKGLEEAVVFVKDPHIGH